MIMRDWPALFLFANICRILLRAYFVLAVELSLLPIPLAFPF